MMRDRSSYTQESTDLDRPETFVTLKDLKCHPRSFVTLVSVSHSNKITQQQNTTLGSFHILRVPRR